MFVKRCKAACWDGSLGFKVLIPKLLVISDAGSLSGYAFQGYFVFIKAPDCDVHSILTNVLITHMAF